MSTDGLRLKACRYVMVAMALVPAGVACAQDAPDQQADHLIRTEMAAQKIPGVSVALESTLTDCEALLRGDHDGLSEEDCYMRGSLH